MRRRQTTDEPPKAAVRRCESCGATAFWSALRCTVCGQPFATAEQVSQLWGSVGPAATAEEPPFLDLYASERDGRVFRVGGSQTDPEPTRSQNTSDRRPTAGPLADPWASVSGTLGALPGRADSGAFAAPASTTKVMTERRRGGGLRTVLVGLLLLLVVGGAAAWFAGRPYLSQQIAGNVGGAMDDELEAVAALPVDAAGRITIVERDITSSLRANAAAYEPVTDPRVALSRSGVQIIFSLYGVEHTLTGKLAGEGGRVVIVDPALAGPASRLIDLTEIVASTEESIADMFARLDTRPVSVQTSDDTLVIVTEPV